MGLAAARNAANQTIAAVERTTDRAARASHATVAGAYGTWRSIVETPARIRDRRRRREIAEREAKRTAALRLEMARRDAAARMRAEQEQAVRRAVERVGAQRWAQRQERIRKLVRKDRARRRRRRRIATAFVIVMFLLAGGLATGVYYLDAVPVPAELQLPESTMVYYSDGRTPMAKLGRENRTILAPEDMADSVKQAIVSAEDRSFWTNGGVDFSGVMRAFWNNARGGPQQGASTITQQYARIAADLTGITYSRKAREAMIAWKLGHQYSKDEILGFYLNTVPFGRGAYGIEAAAQAFFGKTADRHAALNRQLTVSEAMLLASLVKQPEPDPADPDGHPGYDPARGGTAAANSRSRWEYVRDGMVALGFLTVAEAEAMEYPTVKAPESVNSLSGMDRPTGLVVSHVLSELRQSTTFRDQPADFVPSGGYRIVTTIDKRAQDIAEATADIRRSTAPAPDRGQPGDWQAALVAVQPGSGRVLAYYGGSSGTGADHAGWYYDEQGEAVGYGQHPPGSSFKVYDLAEALQQGVSVWSHFDSPAVKEFPASYRTRNTKAGPIRNSSSAPCQPDCALWQATVASLNVPFFDLTEKLGRANVIDMAHRAGVESIWSDLSGKPVRVDLQGKSPAELNKAFTTEVGIGQYGITVLDHANGLATLAAGGKRAQAHFVREVTKGGERVYAEPLTQTDIGLTKAQVDQLNWALGQVPSARLDNGWDSAGKTGTWQAGTSTTQNAHTWMVGYTGAMAVAVWLGTTDGKPLRTSAGKYDVFGSSHAAPIWKQFMLQATAALGLKPNNYRFTTPAGAPPLPTPALTPTRR